MKKNTVQQLWATLLVIFFLNAGLHPVNSSELSDGLQTATFGGGCFWCTEHDFDEVKGVISTTSGYTGGHKKNPTYEEVTSGRTGHTEVVKVIFDPKVVSYEKLLHVFWRSIDPTVKDAQFCDQGNQYRSAIFYHTDQQRKLSLASKDQLKQNKPFKEPIVTEITAASIFYPAETYHQDFHNKNPIRYKLYRRSCGRDRRLAKLWGGEK